MPTIKFEFPYGPTASPVIKESDIIPQVNSHVRLKDTEYLVRKVIHDYKENSIRVALDHVRSY